MAGPWNKYSKSGPWQKYGSASTENNAVDNINAADIGRGIPFMDEVTAGIYALPGAAIDMAKGKGFDLGRAYNRQLGRQDALDARRSEQYPVASAVGEVTGGVASSLAVPGAMSASLPKALAATAAYGAAAGASENRDDRLRGAVRGAGSAVAGDLVARGALKTAAPVLSWAAKRAKPSKNVAELAEAGVVMTPGQRGGRVRKFVENAAESVPVLGLPSKAAKRRGLEQFGKAWINDALAPLGVKLPSNLKLGDSTPEVMKLTQEIASSAFDDALAPVQGQLDEAFAAGQAAVRSKALEMPPEQAATYDYIMRQQIGPLVPVDGKMDGKTLQLISRNLRDTAAKYASSGKPNDEFLADALYAHHDELLGWLERTAPESAEKFAAANDAYSNLSRVWDAFSKTGQGDKFGIVTPAQARSAASRRAFGTTTRNVAAGEARMLRLPNAASSVLPDTVPNSGTAERSLLSGLLMGSGAAGTLINPALALPAAMAIPYTPGLDRVFQNTSLGRGKLADLLARIAPEVAAPAGTLSAVLAAQSGN